MNKFNILLVEDDEVKRLDIISFLESLNFDIFILESYALNDSLKLLRVNKNIIDLILLDMSMPLNDINQSPFSPHSHENFGGLDFLSQMKERGINIPVIVITMFDSIQDTSLNDLFKNISKNYKDFFIDLIYYNSRETKWKNRLRGQLEKLINV